MPGLGAEHDVSDWWEDTPGRLARNVAQDSSVPELLVIVLMTVEPSTAKL
ncbi:hypothetical protein GS934_10185 [Rhodococcus hoagii]|nr:hypothetical protein [Prescottella equi]NKZ87653.1 hypothetical protein [Prescottella equi]